MGSPKRFIVITASDLLAKNNGEAGSAGVSGCIPSKLESDCACPVDDLALVTNSHATQETWKFEDDCACPTENLTLNTPQFTTLNASPYILPALHTAHISDDFSIVFNPLGQAGVVALNQPALSLLNVFQSPKTLDEGVALVGNLPEALSTVHRLAQLNLLNPIGSNVQLTHTAPRTLTVWLHVTNDCNLHCPYCYVNKTADDMEVEQGRQSVDAIFRSAIANGFNRVKIKYAGGEATLNFHTVLILHDHARKLADQNNLELDGVILSNGVAISERMIAEMKVRGIRLMISLDGVGSYHDEQRPFVNGHGSFTHIERGLDRLSAQNFLPSISVTVSNRNLKGLPEVVKYILNRGLPFTINFYRENECSVSFTDLTYQDDMIIAAMKEAFAVIEANLPPHSLLGALVDRAQLESPHDRPCGVGNTYLVINHEGGVAKCHMELERAVTDISVSDPLKVIRNDQIGVQNPSVDEKEGCRECNWRYWCAGGCPALTHRATGRFDVKSPNCNVYKALFPEVLRLEGLRLLTYGTEFLM